MRWRGSTKAFFDVLNWSAVPERAKGRAWPGPRPHPRSAYIKALLVKLQEGKPYISQLRRFLVAHPVLVLLVGFVPEREAGQLYGFNVEASVPCERWLRAWQQHLDNAWLQGLLTGTVHSLQAEIPGLGVTVATDVKHIYAWVQQNNPKAYVSQRYDPKRQPPGDPDCQLGVKRQHNQTEPDGSSHAHTEYVWGYGTGVASATHRRYGDVVLAEYTQPFNEADITYFEPIRQRTQAALGLAPTNWAADAAYDAWYVYQAAAEQGGLAAVPFNRRGQPAPQLDARGFPICPRGLSMHAGNISLEAGGFHTRRLQCPLLFPRPTGQTCDHEQFAKGPGCIKQLNIELGGLLRLSLDRHSAAYRAIYKQRTSTERINSQATALGIERPRVRNIHSVRNLNTLTYILINVRALKRVRAINARARPPT
jgi:Transposase DDE domain